VVLNVVWASASAWGLAHGRVHRDDLRKHSTSLSERE
jgi:hypothetical protein